MRNSELTISDKFYDFATSPKGRGKYNLSVVPPHGRLPYYLLLTTDYCEAPLRSLTFSPLTDKIQLADFQYL